VKAAGNGGDRRKRRRQGGGRVEGEGRGESQWFKVKVKKWEEEGKVEGGGQKVKAREKM
jgi:hypothetical protein